MTTTNTERVAAGAAFLDEHDDGWWKADVERAIDLERLNLQSGEACVLGQRCPISDPKHTRFVAYASALSGLPDNIGSVTALDAIWEWGVAFGFTAPEDSDAPLNELHDALTAEWKRVIEARRSASPAEPAS